MDGWQWKEDYEALLREGATHGEVELRPADAERRLQPRFRLKTQHVFIKVEPRFGVVDVSISGIAVYSDFPFKVGHTVNITMGKAFTVEAMVVDCTLVEAYPDLLETKYRVRCAFEDETTGMQFLVMMKQMEDLERTPRDPIAAHGA